MSDDGNGNGGEKAAGTQELVVHDATAAPIADLRSLWKWEHQRYSTYDGRICVYSIKTLETMLGSGYATAPIAEKVAFLAYCITTKLDPLRKQVYFVKYSQSEPASFVTSWEVFLDRAQRHPQCDGHENGVVWQLTEQGEGGVTASIVRGAPCDFVQDGMHRIVGGWAKAYRKDRKHCVIVEVPLEEMIGKKRDGSSTKFWAKMLTTMAVKTPTARALRQAFPEELSGLYIEEEAETFQATRKPRKPALQAGEEIKPVVLDELAEKLDEEDSGPGLTKPVNGCDVVTDDPAVLAGGPELEPEGKDQT